MAEQTTDINLDDLALEGPMELEEWGHQLFVDYLLATPGMNATQAYMQAYPDASYESARRAASRLLTNDDIKEAIKEGKRLIRKRIWADQDEVAKVAWNVARFSDLTLFGSLGKDGVFKPRPFEELPPGAGQAIKSITNTPTKHGIKTDIKIRDNIQASTLLANMAGHIKHKREVSGPDGGPIEHEHNHHIPEAVQEKIVEIYERAEQAA